MSISALNAGLSGIQSNQRALGISADNVANDLTTGYQPQRAVFQATAPVGSSVTASNPAPALGATPPSGAAAAASGTNLPDEMVNQLTYQLGVEASAKVVKVSDATLGTLLNTLA